VLFWTKTVYLSSSPEDRLTLREVEGECFRMEPCSPGEGADAQITRALGHIPREKKRLRKRKRNDKKKAKYILLFSETKGEFEPFTLLRKKSDVAFNLKPHILQLLGDPTGSYVFLSLNEAENFVSSIICPHGWVNCGTCRNIKPDEYKVTPEFVARARGAKKLQRQIRSLPEITEVPVKKR